MTNIHACLGCVGAHDKEVYSILLLEVMAQYSASPGKPELA